MSNIDKLIEAAGPELVLTDIEVNGVTEQFYIKRLNMRESGKLFWSQFDVTKDGVKMDPSKIPETHIASISRCVCDEKGTQLFPIDAVAKWPNVVSEAFKTAIEKVNGKSQAKVEEAQGNSGATTSSDSSTS